MIVLCTADRQTSLCVEGCVEGWPGWKDGQGVVRGGMRAQGVMSCVRPHESIAQGLAALVRHEAKRLDHAMLQVPGVQQQLACRQTCSQRPNIHTRAHTHASTCARKRGAPAGCGPSCVPARVSGRCPCQCPLTSCHHHRTPG